MAKAKQQEATTDMQALLEQNAQLAQERDELAQKLSEVMSLPSTSAPAPEVAGLPADTFTVNDEEYRMALPKIKVRGVGERTALEVLLDDEEYAALGSKTIKNYLVESGSIAVQKA
jgi:hypothetical protein